MPRSGSAYLTRGKCYVDLKEYDSAIHDFLTAADLMPNDGNLYVELATAYESTGEFAKAISAFETASDYSDDVNVGWVLTRIAGIQLKVGNYSKAIASYEKATKAGGNGHRLVRSTNSEMQRAIAVTTTAIECALI